MHYLLLITDDDSLAISIRVLLKDSFLFEHAVPSRVFEVIAERRPSVVLLDSNLDSSDSMELLKEMVEFSPGITVLKLVNSFSKSGIRAIELGAFDAVEKPFDTEYLLHRIRKALERERLVHEGKRDRKTPEFAPAEDLAQTADSRKENFFEMLFSALAENFPDVRRIVSEFLKILRKHYSFNSMAVFLAEKDVYSPCVSYGIDSRIFNEMRLRCSHPVVKWFMSEKRILNVNSPGDMDFQSRKFLDVINCRIGMPLRTMDGRLKGFLFFGRKAAGKDCSLAEVSSLNLIADYLTTVLDSALLYNESISRMDYQKAIFQNIPAGVIGADSEGFLSIVNSYAERIFCIKAEEVLYKPVEAIGSQIADIIRQTLAGETVFTRREIDYKPAGITVGISTNCLKSPSGEIKGAVAIFQDLTYIKEIQSRERDLERNKYWTSLASRLSHELKNPLVAIKAFAQMLPEKYEQEDFRNDFSGVVQNEIGRINRIVEGINKLADSMELNSASVDITELFREQVKDISGRGLKVKSELNGSIPVDCDFIKVKEALGYISDFIAEDTGGEGEAVFGFKKGGGNLFVEIEEGGSNISFKDSSDIFMPFNPQVHSSISIGLILAKKIFEAHNGNFNIEILPKGKRILLSFPLGSGNGKNSSGFSEGSC